MSPRKRAGETPALLESPAQRDAQAEDRSQRQRQRSPLRRGVGPQDPSQEAQEAGLGLRQQIAGHRGPVAMEEIGKFAHLEDANRSADPQEPEPARESQPKGKQRHDEHKQRIHPGLLKQRDVRQPGSGNERGKRGNNQQHRACGSEDLPDHFSSLLCDDRRVLGKLFPGYLLFGDRFPAFRMSERGISPAS
jgi:hypothetical protein